MIQVLPILTSAKGEILNLDVQMIEQSSSQYLQENNETNETNMTVVDGARLHLESASFVDSNGDIVNDDILAVITPIDVSTPVGLTVFPGSFKGTLAETNNQV